MFHSTLSHHDRGWGPPHHTSNHDCDQFPLKKCHISAGRAGYTQFAFTHGLDLAIIVRPFTDLFSTRPWGFRTIKCTPLRLPKGSVLFSHSSVRLSSSQPFYATILSINRSTGSSSSLHGGMSCPTSRLLYRPLESVWESMAPCVNSRHF